MDPRRLETFRSVARELSFSRAADALHLSQSAVSQQIAALDEHRARLALERRDLLGDRRLGERQRLGRGGERPLGGDLAKDPHAANVEHHRYLYMILQSVI